MVPENSAVNRQTLNREAYRKSFLQHVHQLLQIGFERMNAGEFQNAEEDDITGELCKHMKRVTEESPIEPWMAFFAIHDQDPVNDMPKRFNGIRRGKRRPKLDIRLVSKMKVPNVSFCIEAKRLCRSGSVSDYVGEEGLGAFLDDYYAAQDDFAGMLGYVQTDSVEAWYQKLCGKIPRSQLETKACVSPNWCVASFPRGPKHLYSTVHLRKSGKRLEVFHTFFSFCA